MRSFLAYAAFTVSLSILVILSFIYNRQFRAWSRYNDAIEHSQIVLSELDNLLSYLKDTETSSRGFLLSGDSAFLQALFPAKDSIPVISKRIQQLVRDNPKQQRRMKELDVLVQKRLDVLQKTNLMYIEKNRGYIKSLRYGKEIMDTCRALARKIKTEEQSLFKQRQRMKDSYEIATPNSFVVIFSFTIVSFLISFIIIMTEFRSRISYQRKLESTISELDQFNNELSQIAHISSHHLQEPLRKLSLFSDQLFIKHSSQMNEEARNIVSRVHAASARIRELIEDLSKYTNLINQDSPKETLSIAQIVHSIREEHFDHELKKENLQVDDSLTIHGHLNQIELLFECLIHNSIKFAKPGVDPVIHITSTLVTPAELRKLHQNMSGSFIRIVVRDNGIGFDDSMTGKMFDIFQKLHPDYEGKGIGLAIVKRVLNNHRGFVGAKGVVNEGAEFWLYFPKV